MQEIHQAGLPVRAALGPSALYVELQDIARGELRDPFMQETVKRLPARKAVIEIPKTNLAGASGEAPAGLIFHVARCGSTLISQLLKQHEGVVVYAEPLPFNQLLVPPHKWERPALIAALRALGAHFARHAGKPFVLKLTSWNTLFCDVLVEAFPASPWVLCVRDPLEVCVSLQQHAPSWLRDSSLFGAIVDPERASRSADDYVARFFGAFCKAAGGLPADRGALVPYQALPGAVWDLVAPHFGLSLNVNERARMAAESNAYSKAPLGKATAFVPDDAKKRAAASPELREAVDAFARPELARLFAKFRA